MTDDLSVRRQAWQTLIERPLDFVDPQYLRHGWPQTLSEQQHAAINAAARFVQRRIDLLLSGFNLQPLAQVPRPAEQDLQALLLEPDAFAQLPRRCGAIWHAATLSREIRSDVVNTLRDMLGSDVFALALARKSLAGAVDLLRRPIDLVRAIDRDGASLVAAWLDLQPSSLRPWLGMRFSLSAGEGPAIKGDLVLEVVRCAAASFDQPVMEPTP
nr:type III secretion protein [uncultured Pseudomonas sp.]